MSTNLLALENYGIETQQFLGALNRYQQANCSVSLTEEGYRIYRPPNQNNASNGGTNNMWGGFLLKYTSTPTPLVKGHTYILGFDIKGQTSAGINAEAYWSYNMGNSGSSTQLNCSPSDIKKSSIPSNWESDEWRPYFYQWTINDDVYKVSATTWSSFVEGNTYLSYRDFKFGFNYSNTGTLGTDLYIRNLRMYDITNGEHLQVNKEGQLLPSELIEVENRSQVSITNMGNALVNSFYEY